jgi:hypothetical protein
VILDVAGAAVGKELADLREAGKRAVLMQMKSGDTTRFIALPSITLDYLGWPPVPVDPIRHANCAT